MYKSKIRRGHALPGFTIVALLIAALSVSAAAQTYVFKTLYAFGTKQDGQGPVSTLTLDAAGNLYGTTAQGGANGGGVVFKLRPDGRERVLYNFCSAPNCSDGYFPGGGVIADSAGNLYGTVRLGGIRNGGGVYALSPDGQETLLYSFCQGGGECRHGHNPTGNLIMDQQGNLYGTGGTVFEISKNGAFQLLCRNDCLGAYNGVARDTSGNIYGTNSDPTDGGNFFELTAGVETVLCNNSGNCGLVEYPSAPPLLDGAGNLYGVTRGDLEGGVGQGNYGTVFKLMPGGSGTVLYTFCQENDCADGEQPNGPIVMDASGNIYGATLNTVFEITADGEEIVLHAFCASGPPCTDGFDAMSGLIMDQSGNLYGGTSAGEGPQNRRGTIFELVRQ